MKQKNQIIISILLISLMFFTIACEQPRPPSPPSVTIDPGTYSTSTLSYDEEIVTKQFQSETELLNFIKENQGSGYYGGIMMERNAMVDMDMAVMEESVPMAAPTAKAGGEIAQAPTDFSETNIQVKGVDEADIIKTDGNYIYTVSKKVLYIIKAYPGEDAEIVSTIKFDNKPESIFINGDNLAVFGNFYDNDYFNEIDFRPVNGMTFFNIYDISDRNNPELTKEYKFEGRYFRARMTNGYAYFITSSGMVHRPIPMPVIFEDNVMRSVAVEDIFYFDIPYQNAQFVNINAINLKNPSEDVSSKTIAVEGSRNMYMSQDNIYITYTERINEWDLRREITIDLLEDKLSNADKKVIEKIKATDNDVLSRQEKENKIWQIYQTYINFMSQEDQDELEDDVEASLTKKLEEFKFFEFTIINKINVDKASIKPEANGKVPGQVLNQFSMDEYDDVFRIATTVSPRWSRFSKERSQSTNNIYTLDKDLEILDELEGLAEGERIFSTRFIRDKLYMVTFRQVDPFFVIDLADPSNIVELGELKIPGFSRYLHPYDENTIIGIGKDATETGRQKGLKISLFDVSDFENPKEIANYIADERYSDSSALYEHKAFLFSKEKEMLVIPAHSRSYRDEDESYNGAFVFKITKDEIELRGLIDHSMAESSNNYRYQPLVERSLYIEELLYTKSPSLLRINRIEDLGKVKNIELKESSTKIPVY
ncbi:beta-propeller domain-containing protein [Nanoarchaeota archaeon]